MSYQEETDFKIIGQIAIGAIIAVFLVFCIPFIIGYDIWKHYFRGKNEKKM